MRLLSLSIRNFRGIGELDWTVRGDAVCLVGCGDSTKTTILDAIDLALSARWNVAFSDADFHRCDVSRPIAIRATVGDIPKDLLDDSRLGLFLSGWDDAAEAAKEYEDGDEAVVVIELRVDQDLEPEWLAVVGEGREERRVSSRERERLGVARLGEFVDRHASWSRGSALARLGEGGGSVREVLAQSHRGARTAVSSQTDTPLHATAKSVEGMAAALGVKPTHGYVPGLDARGMGDGAASLCLHDGDVPVRMSGVGTRRLVAAAIQRSAVKKDGAILVDEVEHGLEPFRLVHLLRVLTSAEDGGASQVFMTTHSSVVVAELGAPPLRIVRSSGGRTVVHDVPTEEGFSRLVRACPEALLAKRVIVVEGPTEGGICWALDRSLWPDESFAMWGVVAANGAGCDQGPGRAMRLAALGYSAAFFGDSDETPSPPPAEMAAAGVEVMLWDGGVSTEQRIMLDLPLDGLQEAVDLAVAALAHATVAEATRQKLPHGSPPFSCDVQAWLDLGGVEGDLRVALGAAAKSKKNSWYKDWTRGQALGAIVLRHLPTISATPLGVRLHALLAWSLSERW